MDSSARRAGDDIVIRVGFFRVQAIRARADDTAVDDEVVEIEITVASVCDRRTNVGKRRSQTAATTEYAAATGLEIFVAWGATKVSLLTELEGREHSNSNGVVSFSPALERSDYAG